MVATAVVAAVVAARVDRGAVVAVQHNASHVRCDEPGRVDDHVEDAKQACRMFECLNVRMMECSNDGMFE